MDAAKNETYSDGQKVPPSVKSVMESEDEAEASLIAALEKRERRLHRIHTPPVKTEEPIPVNQNRSRSNTPDNPLRPDGTNIIRHRRKISLEGVKTNETDASPPRRSLYDVVMLAKQKGYGKVRLDEPSSYSAFSSGGRVNFADLAERTREMQQKTRDSAGTSDRNIDAPGHVRRNTHDKLPFEGVGTGQTHGRSARNLIVDNLFDHVEAVETLFQMTENIVPENANVEGIKEVDEETGPNDSTPLLGGKQGQENVACPPRRKFRFLETMNDVIDPGHVLASTAKFLLFNVLLVMAPCLVISAIFFYKLGNPEIDFLPLQASVSWWIIFFVRQLVTLQLAFCSQYFFVDMLSLRSTLSIKIFGPLLTLFGIQGKGWPLVLVFWAVWDLLIMHGEQPFQKNWLYFANIKMFSEQNTDNGIIGSELYLRILLSAMISGGAVAVKRTYMALYLGKRTFFHFKKQLGSLITNMILLADIAELAEDFEGTDVAQILSQTSGRSLLMERMGKVSKSTKRWAMDINDSTTENIKRFSDDTDDDESVTSSEKEAECMADEKPEDTKTTERPSLQRANATLNSSSGHIKEKLENWKEPENKLDEEDDPSIHDILHFRRVLGYLDDMYPFTTAFGPANTRDSCIKSSQELYNRLLKLAPRNDTLPFDVIKIAAFNEDGQLIEEKLQMLVRLFRPNRHNKLTMLAFIQSCDGIYKKLRFFRASVANSTLIDKVLEKIFNTIFYFVLALVILGVLNFNPWALLVSMSTLVVSFAFALGPSVSKLIEGILLIAVRRPYDLGDRLIITNAEFVGKVEAGDSWLVEDVTLFTTTLRLSSTNEVATINNGAIANARLINATRSPNALVTLDLAFTIRVTHEDIDIFRSAVEKYVKDNPRKWVKVVFLRIARIDHNGEIVEYTLRLQHVKPWSDLPTILLNKGEILKFCTDLMKKRNMVFLVSHRKMDLFIEKNVSQNNAIIK